VIDLHHDADHVADEIAEAGFGSALVDLGEILVEEPGVLLDTERRVRAEVDHWS
jgi:hypothetical protein